MTRNGIHMFGGRRMALAVLAALVIAMGLAWWHFYRHKSATEITLFGNVDQRQVELPFNGTQRVEAVLVSEGDRVARGQVLARLDTNRLAPQAAQAAAQVAAQQQVVDKLRRGARTGRDRRGQGQCRSGPRRGERRPHEI